MTRIAASQAVICFTGGAELYSDGTVWCGSSQYFDIRRKSLPTGTRFAASEHDQWEQSI